MTASVDDEKGPALPGLRIFVVLVLGVLVVVFATTLYFFGWPKSAGEVGDIFGSATSLFSGLAFAGLISTLLLQRQELELQRKELAATRDEFSRQRFENTFFGLIDLFNGHVSDLEERVRGFGTVVPEKTLRGREVLRRYASQLPVVHYEVDGQYDEEKGKVEKIRKTRTLEEQLSIYEQLYDEKFEANLGPYFRLIYGALRHIEQSRLSDIEKLSYSKVLRGYLSSSDVKLLMFNCSSVHGAGMKPWLTKHRMLKHIHPDVVEQNKAIARSYSPRAFGDRSRILRILEQ